MIEKGKYYMLTKELPFDPHILYYTINYEYAQKMMFGGYLGDSYKQVPSQIYSSTGKFCVGRIYYCEDGKYLLHCISL